MSLKIVFMGTPEFSIPALETLVNSSHKIICVYTQPPKKKARGQKILKSPVHIFSEKEKIKVKTSKLSLENEYKEFIKLKPDLVVVVAYGQIIPELYLKISNLLFLNVHASLLPRWRGAAPIERAILNKDKTSGISIMKIEKELDKGPFLQQVEVDIKKDTTSEELKLKLSQLGAEALIETINLITLKKEVFTKQNEDHATYAPKIKKNETKIEWDDKAENIIAKINAFSSKPGAWFLINKERIKIIKATEIEMNGQSGEILDDKFTIGCSKNAIQILKLQKEGKKIMSAADFLIGNELKKGTKLN
tara:strand:+ start:4283 stop:5200 length:918 start_codon:yes stop_codon:yes gene_type:complete